MIFSHLLKVDKLFSQPILKNHYYKFVAKLYSLNLNYSIEKLLWVRVWDNLPFKAFKLTITFLPIVSQKWTEYMPEPFSILYTKQEFFSCPKFQYKSMWFWHYTIWTIKMLHQQKWAGSHSRWMPNSRNSRARFNVSLLASLNPCLPIYKKNIKYEKSMELCWALNKIIFVKC